MPILIFRFWNNWFELSTLMPINSPRTQPSYKAPFISSYWWAGTGLHLDMNMCSWISLFSGRGVFKPTNEINCHCNMNASRLRGKALLAGMFTTLPGTAIQPRRGDHSNSSYDIAGIASSFLRSIIPFDTYWQVLSTMQLLTFWEQPLSMSCNSVTIQRSSHTNKNWCRITESTLIDSTWCEQSTPEEYPTLALVSRSRHNIKAKVETEEEGVHVTWKKR